MTLSVESILLSLASAVIGGLVVAMANHWMTRARERTAKNREIVLTKLVNAWELLDDAIPRDKNPPKWKNFEDVQRILLLYGTKQEFEYIKEITDKLMKEGGHIQWGPLQRILKDRIRAELGLEPIDIEHRWIHIEDNTEKPPP